MGLLDQVFNTINPSEIDDFKGAINKHQGPAQTNRFAVIMTPPTQSLFNLDLDNILGRVINGDRFGFENFINDPRDVGILCESCSLPGRRIQTTDYSSNQDWWTSQIPTSYNTEPVSFSFHLTNDYYIKKFFDRWIGSVISQTNYLLSHDDTYKTDVIIQQLNKENRPIYGVKLRAAFPVEVSAVTLDNNATDQTQKLSVQIAYEDFEVQGGIASTITGVKNTIFGAIRRLI